MEIINPQKLWVIISRTFWAPSQYPKRRLSVRSRKVSKPWDWYFKLSYRFEHNRTKHNTCWRHQMETFSALLAICAGNSPVNGEFPAQRPVTRSFDVFFELRLNKRLSKQSRGWWFETLSRPLWRHCNENHLQILWGMLCFSMTHSCPWLMFLVAVESTPQSPDG